MTPSFLHRTGRWFLNSGIQDETGGVARYYRSDDGRNNAVSTEITGYAASTFVYLHALTGEQVYLDRAAAAARFLLSAWDGRIGAMPFEQGGDPPMTFFFDCGIIVRGLLAAWRATGEEAFLTGAERCGRAMLRDFAAGPAEFHPILTLPDRQPVPRDDRWSRSVGCYQLKSAMAWRDLHEATGDPVFEPPYCRLLEESLRTHGDFLPGHPDPLKVMDRLHAYSYFLEALLPCAADPRCAAATREGIARLSHYLRLIGPQFERSDVYAQLLRVRLFADWNGVEPLDTAAASFEAAQLARFQCASDDPRIDGGFWFGRRSGGWLPFVNPVSASFGLQALAMWEQHLSGAPQTYRHMLI